MKKIVGYFIITFLLVACSNQPQPNKPTNNANDSITDLTLDIADEEVPNIDSLAQHFEKKGSIVKIKNALPNNAGVYVHFQLINGKAKNLKLYIQYEDHDIYRFSVDGERYTYKTLKSRGRGDSKISWYDYPVKTMDFRLLRSVIKSESARIVFSDGTSVLLGPETKDAIKKTFDYFELLGGTFPPYM